MVEYVKIRLWADRARMVQKYTAAPGIWPDGVDSDYVRWYSGHEDYWRDKVGHLKDDGRWDGGIDDDAAYESWADGDIRALANVASDGPMDAAERMRRYRARKRGVEDAP